MPDIEGLSETFIRYAKRYSFYYESSIKSHQLGGQLSLKEKSHQLGGQLSLKEKSHQLGGQLEMPKVFGIVPWKHHIYIVSKSNSLEEALF